MMLSELLEPLATITAAAESLLSETAGLLNVYQENVLTSIRQVAGELNDLLISLPDLTSSSTQELLSYETRSHLASVIGYAEVLLDQEDGALTSAQVEQVNRMRTGGKTLLGMVLRLIEVD